MKFNWNYGLTKAQKRNGQISACGRKFSQISWGMNCRPTQHLSYSAYKDFLLNPFIVTSQFDFISLAFLISSA